MRIDTGHHPLRRGLFIAGRPVDLAGEIESRPPAWFRANGAVASAGNSRIRWHNPGRKMCRSSNPSDGVQCLPLNCPRATTRKNRSDNIRWSNCPSGSRKSWCWSLSANVLSLSSIRRAIARTDAPDRTVEKRRIGRNPSAECHAPSSKYRPKSTEADSAPDAYRRKRKISTGFSSPYCGSRISKSIVRASSRAGVPVFIRPASKPIATSDSVTPCEAGVPRPAALGVRTTAVHQPRRGTSRQSGSRQFGRELAPPCCVRIAAVTCRADPPPCRPAVPVNSSSTAVSCQMIEVAGVFRAYAATSAEKRVLSHWARGLHIAAPFERLSMRNWTAVRSVIRPICPPKASISLTI